MNIVYVLHSTEVNGGATKAFLNMLDGVMKGGVKPFVMLPGKDGVYTELKNRRIPMLVVNYRSSVYPAFRSLKEKTLFVPKTIARAVLNLRATKKLTAFIKENRIDVVHSNSGVVRVGFDAAQKAGVPHIYHIREYADMLGYHYFPTKGSFAKQLDRNMSYTVCITKAIQMHYKQKGREGRSRVIYDGVFSELAVMPAVAEKNYFLFAGRIQPPKGLDQLLQAYKLYTETADNPLHLRVAGSKDDNVYYQSLLKYIKDNNLTEFVEFLGNCDDMAALMRGARSLIVSSPFEGFGFTMPEAMQQGCLVIGRNTSGTKEQLDNALEMTGQEIALRYETTSQLAALMAEVAGRPDSYYDDYLRRAFCVVNQLYTKEAHAREVLRLYEEILAL